MKKLILALALLLPAPAFAGVSCSVPFNLQNGTTADASQVMANYNAIIACLANAAAAGANSDITSLNGLTTPLAPSEGGSTVFAGGTATGTGNAQIVASTSPNSFSLTKNYTVVYVATAANTTATTLAVGGQAATNVFKQSAAGPVALTGGEIATNQIVVASYDGTQFEINPFPTITAGFGLSSPSNVVQISQTHPPYGFDACVNLQLNASIGSNLLTIAVKAADTGADPTSSHPVLCAFRDATIANGDPVWVSITAALSINTNGTGATLGTVNGVPFRFWVVLFYNGGTPNLGLYQTVTGGSLPTSVAPIDETSLVSPTAISGAATSAATYYSPNGSSISNSPFRILGYADYANGLPTAGTYAMAPTKVQLFGPGIHKPGDIIQSAYNATTQTYSTTSTNATATGLSLAITPTSAPDLIEIEHRTIAPNNGGGANTGCGVSVFRGATLLTPEAQTLNVTASSFTFYLDAPGTTSSTTYQQGLRVINSGTCTINGGATGIGGGTLMVQEIQD